MKKQAKINQDYLIYESYTKIDDTYGLIVAMREYLKSENFNKYHVEKQLNCLFAVLFDAQKNLEEFIQHAEEHKK